MSKGSLYLGSVFIMSLVLATAGQRAEAQSIEPLAIRLEGKIQHTLQMNWSRVWVHENSCYPLGKGDDYEDLQTEQIKFETVGEGNTLSSGTSSAKWWGIGLGTIQAGASAVSATDYNVTVSLRDNLQWSGTWGRQHTNCAWTRYHWKIASHRAAGQLNLVFKMPSNTWVVRVSASDVNGAGTTFPKNMQGDLHSAAFDSNGFYVWGEPGAEVKVPMIFDTNSSGGALIGYKLKIDPLLKRTKSSAIADWTALRSKFASYTGDQVAGTQLVSEFLTIGSELLRSKTLANELANAMSREDYQSFLDWLFTVANASDLRLRKDDMHVKAMAAAVGYRLANSMLEDMSQFCRNVEVYLPLSNRTIRPSGFIAAHYWINRDVRRIQDVKFPELRAYLNEMVRWENNGMSYADIANRDSEYKKLRDGFLKIRRHSEIAFDVYGDLKLGLTKTMSVFGSYGASQILDQAILSELSGLSQDRAEFNRAFQEEFGKFNRQNSSKIKSSELLKSLTRLESRSNHLGEELLSKVKLLSMEPDSAGSSVIGLMTSLLAHQVAIFDEPLSAPFAEPIRRVFARNVEGQKLRASYAQCLGGGR